MAAGGKPRCNANGQGGVYRRPDGSWEAKVFVDTPDGRRNASASTAIASVAQFRVQDFIAALTTASASIAATFAAVT